MLPIRDAYRQDREADIIRDFVDLLSIPNVANSLPDMERDAGLRSGAGKFR